MAEILILYKNGIAKYKNESKLNEDDIEKAKYFLIPSATTEFQEHRSYIIIRPSKLLLFENAYIEYQLCLRYDIGDYEDDGVMPIKPIKINTKSISDLIRLINCADKINIPNNFIMTNFESYNECIGLCYFGIRIEYKNNKAYEKYYQLNGVSSVLYDSYQITKKFKDIYDNNLISKIFIDNKMIYIDEKNKTMIWNIDDIPNHFNMVGIPSVFSNSIIFCTQLEFENIMQYNELSFDFMIYFDEKKKITSLTKYINNGNYAKVISIIDSFNDIYCDNTRLISTEKKFNIVVLPEVLANLDFIFNSVNLIYSEVYQKDDNNLIFPDYEFDSILTIKLKNKKSKIKKEIILNSQSIITPTQMLSIL